MMKFYPGSAFLDSNYPAQAVVVIGNFDGVHLGHQAILSQAKSIAATKNTQTKIPVTVFTFNPHPTIELRPQVPLKLLMTYAEKRSLLEKSEVDFCVEEPFNGEFSKTTAHDFFHTILKSRLHAAAIVVGEDFFFGHKREGTQALMKQYCEQTATELCIVKPILIEGSPVSSSRIREALLLGKLDEAKKLLGRAFFYRGEIVHGDKRGRTMGFPTANMVCEEKFPLMTGVYATSVIWREQEYKSVTNIGTRPTFQNANQEGAQVIPIRIETHILDQDFDLYGETLEVRFHQRLREEKKFNSVDELKTQIASDIILAREIFK